MIRLTLAALLVMGLAGPAFADDPPAEDPVIHSTYIKVTASDGTVLFEGGTDSVELDESGDDKPGGGLLFQLGKALLGGGTDEPAAEEADGPSEIASPTHRQVRVIKPQIDGRRAILYSFKTTPDGLIAAIVGSERGDERLYEIQLIDHEGAVVESARLDGKPSGVAVAPDGTIYVGGAGRVLMLEEDLAVAESVASPHVGDPEAYREKLVKQAREEAAGSADIYKTQLATMTKAIEKLEAKDEPTRIDKARLKMYRQQAEVFEELIADAAAPAEVDDAQLTWTLESGMAVTSMAAGEDYVFVCAREEEGYGKSVWRMTRDLDPDSAKVVLSGMSGCCGQFDIQCCPEGIVCSENTSFRVATYDFDGQKLSSFGRRDRSSRAGFGSCCNPMNSLPMADGTVLTAESSIGHIKRFDAEGNLVAYVGKAKIGGGCKHCAMGHDAARDLYYMMAEDDSAICVLGSIAANPMTEADLRAEAFEANVLERLAGQWEPAEKSSRAGVPFGGDPVEAASLMFGGQTLDCTFADPEGQYYGSSFSLAEVSADGEVGESVSLRVNDAAAVLAFAGPNTVDVSFGGEAVRYVRTSDAEGNACDQDACGSKAGCEDGCEKPCCSGAGCVTDGGCEDDGPAGVVTASKTAAAAK